MNSVTFLTLCTSLWTVVQSSMVLKAAQCRPDCIISSHSTLLHPMDVTCCSVPVGSYGIAFFFSALLFFFWSHTEFCFILENGQQAYEEVFFTANVTADGSVVSLRNLLWMYSIKCSERRLFQEHVVSVIHTLVKKMGLIYLYSCWNKNRHMLSEAIQLLGHGLCTSVDSCIFSVAFFVLQKFPFGSFIISKSSRRIRGGGGG